MIIIIVVKALRSTTSAVDNYRNNFFVAGLPLPAPVYETLLTLFGHQRFIVAAAAATLCDKLFT